MNKIFSYLFTFLLTAVLVGCTPVEVSEETVPETEEVEEVVAVADCSDLDDSWSLFFSSETSLSFCYKKDWGETKFKASGLSPEVQVGEVYYVSFSKSINNSPLVRYQTPDFQRLGDSDVPPGIDWTKLDFNKSDEELAELFSGENPTLEKMEVNGKAVLKVHKDFIEPLSQERITPVEYFMPNVTISGNSYNLQIFGSSEIESDLDLLLGTITF